jgi:hypothetical protein
VYLRLCMYARVTGETLYARAQLHASVCATLCSACIPGSGFGKVRPYFLYCSDERKLPNIARNFPRHPELSLCVKYSESLPNLFINYLQQITYLKLSILER